MPAYATNMRMKFPIVALALEIVIIILFAVFVTYDDGKSHGHDPHSNATHHEEPRPMELYPSKCAWGCRKRDAPLPNSLVNIFLSAGFVVALMSTGPIFK